MTDTTREVLLVCTGQDPDLSQRLRAAVWRGIAPVVFLRADDAAGRRLATAAGAHTGSIFPDCTGSVVLVEPHAPQGPIHLDRPAVVDGTADVHADGGVWSVISADNATPPPGGGLALRDWDASTLDALTTRGWRPVSLPAVAPTTSARPLEGLRVIHVTSVHKPDDGRIFHREVMALRAAGADATVLGFDPRPSRTERLGAGWRLLGEARRRGAEVLHIHDPELLPAACVWRRRTGRPVIYDAHEYLGQTTRTKPWIPSPLRLPAALAVERIERALAHQVDAVITVTEDMALDFAERGIRAVSVANFASATRFPEPGAAEPGLVVYVGALDASRGLQLMLEAFPMVDAPGARLVLAGPGSPGVLPPGVQHIGPVAYADVPGVLDRASVVWIPLRRTPNNDRGRLTKVMEAMASGRPIVASDLTRTAAIITSAGCGVIVPFDDPAAHAAALTDLLRAPDRARAMGAAGRATFRDRFTFEREAAKLVALYAELTGRTP